MRVTVACAPSAHNSQILTGLTRLARMGRITLEHRRGPQDLMVLGHVDDVPVCFDMRDGDGIDSHVLMRVHRYFKRSYLPSHQHDRVRPLGLNYEVYDDRDLLARLRRRPTVSQVAAPPTRTTSPAVLFLTRLWHTGTGDPQRDAITDSRVRLVRLLRQELGEAFVGGLRADEFSLAKCRDVVVPRRLTDKANYLRLMKTTPICITTVGLHGSNGWKLGEYVAASRAIVTEALRYAVPGDFAAGRNYLSFTTPDECVHQVVRLMKDKQRREAMMVHNQTYYRSHLKPEMLVLDALRQCV